MDVLTGATASMSFNSPVETGLRSLCLLTAAHPSPYTLERLTVCDYLLVHSDDIVDGPAGLHPRTPYRGGELVARRGVLQDGLLLYISRRLIDQNFTTAGVQFVASNRAAAFLDALTAPYVRDLRERADWVVSKFGRTDADALAKIVEDGLGRWGAEFTLQPGFESVRTT